MLLKTLSSFMYHFFYLLIALNAIQLVTLIVLLIYLIIILLKNQITRQLFFNFLKRIFIASLISLMVSLLVSNHIFCFSLSNNTKESLKYLGIASISFFCGMSFWFYKNYNQVFINYQQTIDAKILEMKYITIKNYGESFVKAGGVPKKYVTDLSVMCPHMVWNRDILFIFKSVYEGKANLSMKEWVCFGMGINYFSKHTEYFYNLVDILLIRKNSPEVFKAGYFYYQHPEIPRAVTNLQFLTQELKAFELADDLLILEEQLKYIGAPSNFFINKKFFGKQNGDSSIERDNFFSNFSGITFEKYITIDHSNTCNFNTLIEKINLENLTLASFSLAYPFFWILDTTLGLPNPIPKELFYSTIKGTTAMFFQNSVPSYFYISPSDLYDPYIFCDDEEAKNIKTKDTPYHITKQIRFFRDSVDNLLNREEK